MTKTTNSVCFSLERRRTPHTCAAIFHRYLTVESVASSQLANVVFSRADVQSVLNEFCSDAQGVTSSLADASSTLASFASDATESFASATESLASAASSVTESLASVASSITDDAASATSETGNAAMPTHAMLDKWNGLAAVGVAVGVLGL